MLQRCDECATWVYYPRVRCPHCLSDQLTWTEVDGRGTVYTFTVAVQPTAPPFADEVPQLLAIVELTEGVRLSTHAGRRRTRPRSPSAWPSRRCSTTATTASPSCASAPPAELRPLAGPPDGRGPVVMGEDPPMGFLEDRAGLNGKVALIAGGGGGLGRAIALDYARAGMKLVLCDKNEELLDADGRRRHRGGRGTARRAHRRARRRRAHADVRRLRRALRAARRAGERRRRHVQGRLHRHERARVGRHHPRQLRLAAAEHAARGAQQMLRAGRRRQHHQHHVDRRSPRRHRATRCTRG